MKEQAAKQTKPDQLKNELVRIAQAEYYYLRQENLNHSLALRLVIEKLWERMLAAAREASQE